MVSSRKKTVVRVEQAARRDDFKRLVDALCVPGNGITAGIKKRSRDQALPSRQVVGEIVEELAVLLLVHGHAHAPHVPRVQGLDESDGVDQRPP